MGIETVEELRKRIRKEKEGLRSKAEENGIYENFGQKRVRKVKDDLNLNRGPYRKTIKANDLIAEFENWCMTFDISNLGGA